MGILDIFFGKKTDKLKDFQSRGAVIIDVRTKGEYDSGAIPGSKNMSLQTITTKVNIIKKLNKPVITCCASGIRSGSAASILRAHGIEVINGGGWFSLSQKLELHS